MPTAAKGTKKKTDRGVYATLAMFDRRYDGDPIFRVKVDGLALGKVRGITVEDYVPYGSTPLRDATMSMIQHLDKDFAAKPDAVHIGLLLDESGSMSNNVDAVVRGVNEFVEGIRDVKPDGSGGRVLCVVVTDGYENASEYASVEALRQAIHERESAGWTFIYLGANQDAWATGEATGFSGGVSGQTVNYVPSARGTASAMRAVTQDAASYLSANASWQARRKTTSQRSISEDGHEVAENTTTSKSPGPVDVESYGNVSGAINRARRR